MDTNMEDVGRVPTDLAPMPTSEPTTIPTLDGWIENLMKCKQLAEADVQRLCDKVSPTLVRFVPIYSLLPSYVIYDIYPLSSDSIRC